MNIYVKKVFFLIIQILKAEKARLFLDPCIHHFHLSLGLSRCHFPGLERSSLSVSSAPQLSCDRYHFTFPVSTKASLLSRITPLTFCHQ